MVWASARKRAEAWKPKSVWTHEYLETTEAYVVKESLYSLPDLP